MIGRFCFVLAVLAFPFKSKLRLEAENAMLRHQLNVLRRRLQGRVRLTNNDRWFFIQLYRWVPSILQVLTIIRPETLVRCLQEIAAFGSSLRRFDDRFAPWPMLGLGPSMDREVWSATRLQSPTWRPLHFLKRNVHYVIIGGRDVKSTSCVGSMPGPARDRPDRARHSPRPTELATMHHFAPSAAHEHPETPRISCPPDIAGKTLGPAPGPLGVGTFGRNRRIAARSNRSAR
jgi:hypothetical protein